MVAIRGRTFKKPWQRSCLSSKLKSSSAPIGREDSWCFHAVGSSNAPLLGSTAAEGLPRIGRTSIATHWRSCGLPQSASCSENFVIPPDVFGQTLRGTRHQPHHSRRVSKLVDHLSQVHAVALGVDGCRAHCLFLQCPISNWMVWTESAAPAWALLPEDCRCSKAPFGFMPGRVEPPGPGRMWPNESLRGAAVQLTMVFGRPFGVVSAPRKTEITNARCNSGVGNYLWIGFGLPGHASGSPA